MTYNEWLLCVERTLKQGADCPRLVELDPDALRDAFDAGESPILFGKRDDLPLRNRRQKKVKVSRSWAWLVVPAMLIPLAYTLRFGIETNREREGWRRLVRRNVWPVDLPLKSGDIVFTPAETSEAVAKVKEAILALLLNPGEGKFLSCDAVAATAPGGYLVTGTVESVNQYGTRVTGRFSAVAERPYKVTRFKDVRPPQWKRLSDEWKVTVGAVEGSPTSTVWREDARARSTRLGGLTFTEQMRRGAAGRAEMERRRRGSTSLYGGD